MTPEEELGKTLDQLIYDYDACDSPIADLLRELKEKRARIEAQEDTIKKLREALEMLYDDNMEYFKLNNLSGCENNHVMRVARAALGHTQNPTESVDSCIREGADTGSKI